MVSFTHVLYPTDLSEASLHGARYAAAVARWYGATLTILHVMPTFETVVVPPDLTGRPTTLVPPPSEADVRREMRRAVGDDLIRGLDAHFTAAAGDPVKVIEDLSISSRVDLVVMGTHGRSGFDRLLLGSVTEKILRRVPCPVLTIPPHAPTGPAGEATFRHILCAIDFSPASQQALGFALDLARQANGRVTAASVVEWLAEEEAQAQVPFDVTGYRERLLDGARARLTALLSTESREWCEIDEVVTAGRAHRELLRLAKERHCDLIAIGAQGRGGLGLAVFGSTTPLVVRGATCPVLVVRGAVAGE